MKIEFTIDAPDKIDVVIERDPFSGKFTCVANGQVQTVVGPMNSGAHFGLTVKEVYTVEVGTPEKQLITIEHRGSLLFPAVRPHVFTVTVDGRLVGEYRGQ